MYTVHVELLPYMSRKYAIARYCNEPAVYAKFCGVRTVYWDCSEGFCKLCIAVCVHESIMKHEQLRFPYSYVSSDFVALSELFPAWQKHVCVYSNGLSPVHRRSFVNEFDDREGQNAIHQDFIVQYETLFDEEDPSGVSVLYTRTSLYTCPWCKIPFGFTIRTF